METGYSKKFLFVIFLSILFFVGFRFGCQNISSLFSSSAVNNFRFIVQGEDNTAIAKVGLCGMKVISYLQASFIEVARSGNITVAILKDTNSKYDVYRIEGGRQENLTNDGTEKSGLTISPDASRIAFSYTTKEVGGTTGENSRSEIVILFLAKKEQPVVFGLGTDAHFLDTETIFYQSPGGFALKNMRTNEGAFFESDEAPAFFEKIVSVEGDKLILRNEILPQVDIFELVSRVPLSIGYTDSILGDFIDATSFKNTLYSISQTADGRNAVLKKNDAGMVPLFYFPAQVIPLTFVD